MEQWPEHWAAWPEHVAACPKFFESGSKVTSLCFEIFWEFSIMEMASTHLFPPLGDPKPTQSDSMGPMDHGGPNPGSLDAGIAH